MNRNLAFDLQMERTRRLAASMGRDELLQMIHHLTHYASIQQAAIGWAVSEAGRNLAQQSTPPRQ